MRSRRAEVRAAEPLPEEDDDAPVDLGERPRGAWANAGDVERMQGIERCMNEIPERRRLPIALHLQGFPCGKSPIWPGSPSNT